MEDYIAGVIISGCIAWASWLTRESFKGEKEHQKNDDCIERLEEKIEENNKKIELLRDEMRTYYEKR